MSFLLHFVELTLMKMLSEQFPQKHQIFSDFQVQTKFVFKTFETSYILVQKRSI